jgi:hypothetical protein
MKKLFMLHVITKKNRRVSSVVKSVPQLAQEAAITTRSYAGE